MISHFSQFLMNELDAIAAAFAWLAAFFSLHHSPEVAALWLIVAAFALWLGQNKPED